MLLRRRLCRRGLCLVVLSCTALYACVLLVGDLRAPALTQLTELHRCPACYGVTVCPELYSNQISLDPRSLSHLFNAKNVFYGTARSGKRVVLKKLAHDWELRALDRKLCEMINETEGCKPNDLLNIANMEEQIEKLVRFNVKSQQRQARSGLLLCPDTRALPELLRGYGLPTSTRPDRGALLNALTIILVNAEPIILQTLSGGRCAVSLWGGSCGRLAPAAHAGSPLSFERLASWPLRLHYARKILKMAMDFTFIPYRQTLSGGGWAVPAWGGACGRLALAAHAGEPLSAEPLAPWPLRLHYARQILKAAMDFTFKHDRFRFYLMDWSLDNIAADGHRRIAFVDLEDVIVLDKHAAPGAELPDWYMRDSRPSGPGFTFSVEGMCRHHLSDHNLWAACYVLAGDDGPLLLPIPDDVNGKWPSLSALLSECLRGGDRFRTMGRLQQVVIRMMNALRAMFCGSPSPARGEVHDTVRRIFGEELVMKENTDPANQRSNYVSYIKDNLDSILEAKATQRTVKSPRKMSGIENGDDRHGRIGPKIVVFDAANGTGRMILVGDERVSVQALSNFATIRATACVFAGRWMYEVQLGTKGIMQIGWCCGDCVFTTDTGVGDAPHSYAYDGARVRRWNVATSPYGKPWLSGDVIGSCIDLDAGTIDFYRNGVSMGVAFEGVHRGAGVAYFPAVSIAMNENLYANFGHVPFVFPVDGYGPLQPRPTKECAHAALLLAALDSLVAEVLALEESRERRALRRPDGRRYTRETPSPPPGRALDSPTYPSALSINAGEDNTMSQKAFLMSLARLAVASLAAPARLTYVAVAEVLPRLRAALGLPPRTRAAPPSAPPHARAAAYYAARRDEHFVGLSEALQSSPQKSLCRLLDWLWTFMDEGLVCDILEHCVVRECLLYNLASEDLSFSRQKECVYVLCGLMQHTATRHHLVKYILFGKIMFDNFLHVKCPDEASLRAAVRRAWWERPTSVRSETDPLIAESTLSKPAVKLEPTKSTTSSILKMKGSKPKSSTLQLNEQELEQQYQEDCERISAAVAPLEKIQVEFLLMMLDNTDGTDLVPSTRKIFLEKFKRYIMDNCILDMRLFNISRNTPAISWCCHARLLTVVLRLWENDPLGSPASPPHVPPRAFVDGSLDFYSVDRLGGVLPFLVRTFRQELVTLLGENNAFVQSFEPRYNRGGTVDTAVSGAYDSGSHALATLPQVISSIARFMNATMSNPMNRVGPEMAVALKGVPSQMPGAGCVEPRTALLLLLDGLLAIFHGSAAKHAEKLSEIRDNQLDLADCLYDVERRLAAVNSDLSACEKKELTDGEMMKKHLMLSVKRELQRTKEVYEEKLTTISLQMAWVIGVLWSKRRQAELARHFAGALHSFRLACDADYAAHVQVHSKEILAEKSSLLRPVTGDSYASLQLRYESNSNQSPTTPLTSSPTATPQTGSEPQMGRPYDNDGGFSTELFPFVPEYYVEAALELCNTLRLFMHPTVPTTLIPEWEELLVWCASLLCAEFADARIVLASTRDSLVQTLASFATQPNTMRAIEKMRMIEELVRPYSGRSWAQSNWVLVRFWHGSGFGYRHRQWPHLAASYGDREPTVSNLGSKVDAALMSQCFGPCPSELIQGRIGDYLKTHPGEASAFLHSLLSQINWAFSEFITLLQDINRVSQDGDLEGQQTKLCATCFDLYHGLCRALEMSLHMAPLTLTQSPDLMLTRTCQLLMSVVSRVCSRGGGGVGFARLAARGLPDTDRVHHYVALAPVAGCLLQLLHPSRPTEHLEKVTRVLVTEPLFKLEDIEFMLGRHNDDSFSFYHYPDDVSVEELEALEAAIERLRAARESPEMSGSRSELLCTICYARPADTAFVPCHHHSCRSCIEQHLLNSKQCFFCKSDIQSLEEIEAAERANS